MDLWCIHSKSSGLFLRNSLSDKPIFGNSRSYYYSTAMEIKVSLRYQSCNVKAMAKKNPGNQINPDSGDNDDAEESSVDGLKGNNPMERRKSRDTNSKKPLDWREFRALLYIQEQNEVASPLSQSLPLKWAHPISVPENGCLLVATEKLDGVQTFERTVILILRSGTRHPREGPFGIIINRPLKKKMKHVNRTNNDLATTFSDCCLHFGGPLEGSMFLVRGGETVGFPGFEEVIPGVCYGSRNSLDCACELVKKGSLKAQDFGFFMGYAGWEMEQLREEIESGYWCVVACSANLISGFSKTDHLWEEVCYLIGGLM